MPAPRRRGVPSGLRHAFDEARFGANRTLNLRASLPSTSEAVARAESWLRQKQVEAAHEVLLITGRGNHSEGGVSPVREAVLHLLYSLRRRGVVSTHAEHTPGSFVVMLAPMHELWDAPRRRRERTRRPASPNASALDALEPQTRQLLHDLAERSLDALGVRQSEAFVQSEMLRQFGAISAGLSTEMARERGLRAAIRRALAQYD